MGAVAISISGVDKQFSHNGVPVHALAGIDLDVAPGEFVSIIGPSGCGKSTLLRIVGGLLMPDRGRVTIGDGTPTDARARKSFGLVPQTPALLPWRTVLDNVRLLDQVGQRASRGPGQSTRTAPDRSPDAMALLDQVGLAAFAQSLPRELSGGMQQRVSLVRAFVLGAPILLMDEPFAALDEITRAAMRYQLLEIWQRTSPSVLFVTHSIDEAVILSDRVVVMAARPGRVAATEQIDLPRPRTEVMEDSPEFVAHGRTIKSALRREWVK